MAILAVFHVVLESVCGFRTELLIVILTMCIHSLLRDRDNGHVQQAETAKGAPQQQPARLVSKQQPTRVVNKHSAAVRSHIAALKQFGQEGRLDAAFELFEKASARNTCLYNTLIDVCIDCKDVAAAERLQHEAVQAGLADVVTFNTMMKAHIKNGNLQGARKVVRALKMNGLQPSCVTFNELLDATVKTDIAGAWTLLREMRACGVKPNPVTTSILLKSIQPKSSSVDIEQAMAIVDEMDELMDEVLLSSVVEACVRTGRADLLKKPLQRQRTERRVQVSGAHTYGSLIRASGAIRDVDGVWDTWNQMLGKGILPTSVTFGCMVEALVVNGKPEEAHKLIQGALCNDITRALVNSVVYCSVLKGYSHQRNFGKAWSIYLELKESSQQLSLASFNALLDACARCGEMSRAQLILFDMHAAGIEPNLITYSCILKGYCQENCLDRALELLATMKQHSKLQPDEVTYNTLLEGCARQGLYDKGMMILQEMEEVGIRPTNYTLSVLVKLANRGKQLQKCFELCDRLRRQYRFRMNVHVYNNLLAACVTHNYFPRALVVFQEMLESKVHPDARTYSILLRAHLSHGEAQEASELMRAVFGLTNSHSVTNSFKPELLRVSDGLPPEIVTEVLLRVACDASNKELAVNLLNELRHVPGVKLDPKLSTRLTIKATYRQNAQALAAN